MGMENPSPRVSTFPGPSTAFQGFPEKATEVTLKGDIPNKTSERFQGPATLTGRWEGRDK